MARYSDSPLSADELRQILDLVENSKFEELDLQLGDLHLSVSKTGAARPMRQAPMQQVATAAPAEPELLPPSREAPPSAVPKATQDNGALGAVEITAPVVGIFFVAPEPGARPFIEIGAEVGSDETVGLIEVMKVFNGVKSGVAGTVIERLVEDAQFVEYGQPLFLVRPRSA